MNDTPKEKAAAIRATLKYPDIETFVHRYAQNISKYGIFFKTSKPKAVGTPIKFELKIADGTRVLRGMGDVSWIREHQSGDAPPGMGIKFQKLDKASRETVKKILVFKKTAGQKGPSRFSDAPPPAGEDTAAAEQAKREAEEQAKREAEEQARREAEEQARREAEEQARREAEEQARREAEEQARREAEEQARREAEKEIERKKRAREKLAEHQRSTAIIEADEDEIDEVVAAFDSIQMPGESDSPEAPAKADSHSPAAMADALDADADIAESNLEEALFADGQASEKSDAIESVANLIEDDSPRDSDAGNLETENLFDSDKPIESDSLYPESGEAMSLKPPADEASEVGADASDFSSDDDFINTDLEAEPLDLSMRVSSSEESVSEEIEELSIADMVPESFEESEARSAGPESYRVSREPPLFSENATPSQAPFEAEEFEIEEIDDVDFIEEIEEIEEVESGEESGEVDEMGINFDNLKSRESAAPAVPSANRFDNLVDTYSRGTRQPSSPPQPLWTGKTVDNELNNIFPPGGSAPPAPPAPPTLLQSKAPTRPAPAPETLPDDALPDSLANFIERKSLLPAAQRPSSPGNDSQAPGAAQGAQMHGSAQQPHHARQMQVQPGAVQQPGPNAGMPGQQSAWGPPASGGAPAAPASPSQPPGPFQQQQPRTPQPQPQAGQRPAQPQQNPAFNPNSGMPGQQSAWTSNPGGDADDDEFSKKGFFGKLFGK